MLNFLIESHHMQNHLFVGMKIQTINERENLEKSLKLIKQNY